MSTAFVVGSGKCEGSADVVPTLPTMNGGESSTLTVTEPTTKKKKFRQEERSLARLKILNSIKEQNAQKYLRDYIPLEGPTKKQLKQLQDKKILTDVLMDDLAHELMQRHEDKSESKGKRSLSIITSQLFKNFRDSENPLLDDWIVQMARDTNDVFSRDDIILLIEYGIHRTLGIVRNCSKALDGDVGVEAQDFINGDQLKDYLDHCVLIIADSLKHPDAAAAELEIAEIVKIVKQYLLLVTQVHLGLSGLYKSEADINMKVHIASVPKQKGMNNCGPTVLTTLMEYLDEPQQFVSEKLVNGSDDPSWISRKKVRTEVRKISKAANARRKEVAKGSVL